MEISDIGLSNLVSAIHEAGPGDTIYDIGCGRGRIMEAILDRYLCKGVAADVNAALVRTARSQLLRFGERASVAVGDCREMDLTDATVVVTHFSSNALAVVKDHFAANLKEGCVWLTYAWPVPGWTPIWPEGRNPIPGVHRYVIGPSCPDSR